MMDQPKSLSFNMLLTDTAELYAVFHNMLGAIPSSVFLIDSHGNLLYANSAFLELLDCQDGKLEQAVARLLKTNDDLLQEAIQTVLTDQSAFAIPEYTFTQKDGEQSIFRGTLQPFSFQEENATRQVILGTLFEVTAEKKATEMVTKHAQEIKLLQSAGQKISETLDLAVIYRTFFDLVARMMPHDSLFVSSYKADEGLIYCNFAIVDGVQVDSSKLPPVPLEPEGQGLQSKVIRSGMPLLINDVDEYLKHLSQVHYIDENDEVYQKGEQLPEGTLVTRSALIVPLILSGKSVGAIQVFSYQKDVFTDSDLRIMQALASQIAVASNNALLYEQAQEELAERKKLQAELEEERNLLSRRVEERTADLIAANQELQQALQIKDEFLANMSHELRTPLNAILGMRESLSLGTYGPLDQRVQRPLDLIQQSGEHLLSLINDVLDLTKIQAGRIESNPVQIPLISMTRECLKLVEEMATRKNIHLHFHPGEINWQVRADERQIKQVLLNLLSNAIKFTDENGSVGIEIAADQNPGQVKLAVWDTGIGIRQADMGKLFQPFVQLDSGLSRKYEGTGLGLALSEKLAALNGGKICVESEGQPGKGSRFIVILPAVAAVSGDPSLPDLADDGFVQLTKPRQRILVVEDNLANLETMVNFIDQSGYEVLVARDGQEAIDKTHQEHPDLILMDIQLPVLDGLTAIRFIRQELSMTEIPIIALTALAMPGDKERCLAAGANLYLSKPVRLRTLVDTVGKMLAS